MINTMKKLPLILSFMFLLVAPHALYASQIQTVRVFYRPDGSVSITHFVKEACIQTESELQCMNRITATLGELSTLPYDDMLPSQLPQSRENRDEWRGSKGAGIWVDEDLVTKQEQIDILQTELDAELEKESPDAGLVLKLQQGIDELINLNTKILTDAQVEQYTDIYDNQGVFTAVVASVGNFFGTMVQQLQNSVLALASLVTNTLQVGTSEAPAGITVYDQNTGEPYCLVVVNGVMQNVAGECGAPVENAPDNGTTTPDTTDTTQDDTNSETEDTTSTTTPEGTDENPEPLPENEGTGPVEEPVEPPVVPVEPVQEEAAPAPQSNENTQEPAV
jgi:hypothetical protein